MTRVILDAAVEQQFSNLSDRAEVCDSKGHTLGVFLPATKICDSNGHTLGVFLPATDHSLYRQVQAPFTEEELEGFEKVTGGRPLSEILADLEKQQ